MNQSDELRSIYDRCDVSNNRTDNPMSFADFEDYINANYLPKSQVVKAIGDEEVPATHDSMALAIIKNGLRSDIRRSLSLDGGEGE